MRGFLFGLITLMISGTVGVGADVVKGDNTEFVVVSSSGKVVAHGETPAIVKVVSGKVVTVAFAKIGMPTRSAMEGGTVRVGWMSISVTISQDAKFLVLDHDAGVAYELPNALIVSLPAQFKEAVTDQVRIIDISAVPGEIRSALKRLS